MARQLVRVALVSVCLLLAVRVAAAQDDPAALANALLAVPAADRAHLLEERGLTPTPALVDALLTLGSRRASVGDLDRALDCYQYALALAQSLNHQAYVGESLLGLGQVYGRRADYERAHATTSQALDIATTLSDDRMAAAALNNLGIIYRLQGDYEQARLMYGRVLAMADAAHRDDQIARALTNLGIVEMYQGMYDAAVADLQQSLELGTRLKIDQVVVNARLNLGNVYYFQNNCELALDFYGRVLSGAEQAGNASATLPALNNIAACERATNRLEPSLAHLRRALELAERSKLPAEIARAHYGIAEVYIRQHRWTEALGELQGTLDVRQAIGDRLGIAESLVSMAEALFGAADFAASLEHATRGAALADELDLPEVAFGARTVEGKALAALARDADAEAALREAIRRAEASRRRIAGTEIDRARFLADATEPYVVLAALLARGGRELDSLVVAEQAHARALGEVVSGRAADDVLTEEERARQRDLQKRLGSLNRQIESASATDAARAKELAATRRAVRLEQDQLDSALYAAHPELRLRYGAPPLLDAATLAKRLNRSTALVEYVEGADATLMLIATAGPHGPSVRAHTIPVRAAELDARIAAFTEAIARRDLSVAAEAKALGALLIEPALAAGRSRLVIVPDGALWTLPFQALRSQAGRYVVEDHVVSYGPSIVALQLLADRRARVSAGGGFLGVADPDPAHPLPESRRQVLALAASPATAGVALVGSAATEAAVRKAIVSAGVVHIASHGVFEDASPLYSHVVLAPGGGRDTSNDGRLEAWELMQLRLRASLVVLAACESGRGSIHGGEGTIGLSWAALAAGAPAAVVSLWRVDEAATGAWMSAFYASWRRAGASRAAADAARTLIASEKYRHPFYWAPFVVIGDPSTAPAGRSSQPVPAAAGSRPKGSRRRP